MDKKFRNLILSQVEAVVHDKPAGRQSLYDLLRIATPDLKLHMVDNTSQRESAYRALKVLIHPDKHRKALRNDDKEMARVTRIFQETSAYYNVCCARLAMESPSLLQEPEPPY
jgi:spore coat polysaccharide biosynthesis predicted glycosyltransferase SpsG